MTPGFGRLHPGELSDESAEEFLITEMVPGGGEYNRTPPHPPIVRGSAKQPLPGRSNPWKPHRASGLSFTVHVVTSRRGFSFPFLFFSFTLPLEAALSDCAATYRSCSVLHTTAFYCTFCSRAQQNWQVSGLGGCCPGVLGPQVKP